MSDEIFYSSDEVLMFPIVILQGTPLDPDVFTMSGVFYQSHKVDVGEAKCGKCAFHNLTECGRAPRCNKGTGVTTYYNVDNTSRRGNKYHGYTANEYYFTVYQMSDAVERIQVVEVDL